MISISFQNQKAASRLHGLVLSSNWCLAFPAGAGTESSGLVPGLPKGAQCCQEVSTAAQGCPWLSSGARGCPGMPIPAQGCAGCTQWGPRCLNKQMIPLRGPNTELQVIPKLMDPRWQVSPRGSLARSEAHLV